MYQMRSNAVNAGTPLGFMRNIVKSADRRWLGMTDREKAIVMAYTGYTMLSGDKLGIYYKYVQEKLGRSVMTHELAYQEVQGAIKEAAKEDFIAIAKADNGWVSVKDRLPKSCGNYLVRVGKDGFNPHTKTAYWLAGIKVWKGAEACSIITDVSHWMPLPEPPKGDNNEHDE